MELKIPPPLVALAVAFVMWLLVKVFPVTQIPDLLRYSFSLTFAWMGIAIDVAAMTAFYRAKTTINPCDPSKTTSLIENGIYRISRNPMYLGVLFLLLAWAAYLGSLLALTGPILFVIYLNQFQIRPEEQILEERFGKAYVDYSLRVRRWI